MRAFFFVLSLPPLRLSERGYATAFHHHGITGAAKTASGDEVDFKDISIAEALKILEVSSLVLGLAYSYSTSASLVDRLCSTIFRRRGQAMLADPGGVAKASHAEVRSVPAGLASIAHGLVI